MEKLRFGSPYANTVMPRVRERVEEARSYIQGMEHILDQYDWDYASPQMIQNLIARLQESLRIINSILTQKIVTRRGEATRDILEAQTYGDWVNLAEDIKQRDSRAETWDKVNDSLGVIAGSIPGDTDDAKRWLVTKAGELGIV